MKKLSFSELAEEMSVIDEVSMNRVVGGYGGYSDPMPLYQTYGTNMVPGFFNTFGGGYVPGWYNYEGNVGTYYDPDTGQYSINVGAHILTQATQNQNFYGTATLMINGEAVETLNLEYHSGINYPNEVGSATFFVLNNYVDYDIVFDVRSYVENPDGTWQADNIYGINPSLETVDAAF